MEIKLTIKEIMNKGIWEDVCKLKGIVEYGANEGIIDSEEEITFSEEEAKNLDII